jgi:hypothetical protein
MDPADMMPVWFGAGDGCPSEPGAAGLSRRSDRGADRRIPLWILPANDGSRLARSPPVRRRAGRAVPDSGSADVSERDSSVAHGAVQGKGSVRCSFRMTGWGYVPVADLVACQWLAWAACRWQAWSRAIGWVGPRADGSLGPRADGWLGPRAPERPSPGDILSERRCQPFRCAIHAASQRILPHRQPRPQQPRSEPPAARAASAVARSFDFAPQPGVPSNSARRFAQDDKLPRGARRAAGDGQRARLMFTYSGSPVTSRSTQSRSQSGRTTSVSSEGSSISARYSSRSRNWSISQVKSPCCTR